MNRFKLDRRIKIMEPFKERDPRGGIIQSYRHRGTVWANFKHRASSEAFQQARIEARNPATVAVRVSSLTEQITAEWRLEDDRMIYDVQGDPYLTDDRGFMIIQVEGRRK